MPDNQLLRIFSNFSIYQYPVFIIYAAPLDHPALAVDNSAYYDFSQM